MLKKEIERQKPRTLLKRTVKIVAMIFFFVIAFWLFQLAQFHRTSPAKPSPPTLGHLFSIPKAYAGEEPLVFTDGLPFYHSGEILFGKARDIFRVNPDSNLREFKKYTREALQEYEKALFVWTRVYENLSPDKAVSGFERARLLDAINHALWRMLPFLPSDKQQNVRDAMQRNWIDALDLLVAYEGVKGKDIESVALRLSIQKNLEFFRRTEEARQRNARQNQANDNPFNFPSEAATAKLTSPSGAGSQEKKNIEERISRERARMGQKPGRSSGTGEQWRQIEGVPGVGQMPAPAVGF